MPGRRGLVGAVVCDLRATLAGAVGSQGSLARLPERSASTSLVRGRVLMRLGVLHGGFQIGGWRSLMETAALWAVIALLGVLFTGLVVLTLNLLKQQGRLLLRIERLESSAGSSGSTGDVHHVEPVQAAAP